MELWLGIVIAAATLIIGLAIDSVIQKRTIEARMGRADEAANRILENAKKGYEFFRNETIYHQSPENFRKIIKKMKEMADALPENSYGRKIFMIDNWNEWDEGHYVAPSHEFGFKYLQAIREEPDLSEICKKKYRINPLKTGI